MESSRCYFSVCDFATLHQRELQYLICWRKEGVVKSNAIITEYEVLVSYLSFVEILKSLSKTLFINSIKCFQEILDLGGIEKK